MPTGRIRPSVLLLAVAALLSAVPLPAAGQGAQPSYDVLRIEQDGTVMPYNIWVDWLPLMVATPDGGAWAFFSAQAKKPDGMGTRRLYAARFDPGLGVWTPGKAMPGGEIQFGPSAVVDSKGTVHVVYSDRRTNDIGVYAVLVYTHSDGQGGWVPPTPVAPDPNAGHQMMPSLAIDGSDRLYLVWRDQRSVDPETRQASTANADVFASDYVVGAWSSPTQVNRRPAPDVNAGWPFLVVDGDRLVAVWSVYQGTKEEQEKSAARIEWSTRPLNDQKRWSAPQVLLEQQEGDQIGGRLIAVAPNPGGGATMVSGRIKEANTLTLRRLAPGGEWGPEIQIVSGNVGFLPSLSVGADGTAYIVYTRGRGDTDIELGAQVVPPGADKASPEVVLTQGEEGLQARASIDVGADGKTWIVYMHQPQGGAANEIRALRGARLAG